MPSITISSSGAPAAAHPGQNPGPSTTLDHLLVEAAIQCPEADALVGDFGALSYADLLIRAQNIAVTLRRQGLEPGQYVGVVMDQTPVTITCIAGVILAGAVYVPLSRGALQPQTLRRVREIGVSIILCDGSANTSAPERGCDAWKALGTVLDASRMEQETMPSSSETKMSLMAPDSAAAFLLSSDAQQDPPGVRVSHRRIARLCGTTGPVKTGHGETFLLRPSTSAAAGIFELWSSLLHGASLALEPQKELDPEQFAAWVSRVGVSLLCLPVQRVHQYVDQAPDVFTRLRYLIVENDGRSGAISPQSIEWLQKHHPNLRIVNTYATPRIAGYATAYPLPALYKPQSSVPIGWPLDGLHATILDRAAQQVSVGEIGELAFWGEDVCDDALCMTGERARQRVDGLLELHGRVRGQMAASLLPVEADQISMAKVSQQGLEEQLKVPPVTADGSVLQQQWNREKEQLLNAERRHEKVLDQVRSLWLRLLRREAIGYEEDFFEAGGTQVQLIRMHAELNRKFPGLITMGQLTSLNTIKKIYQHLTAQEVDAKPRNQMQRGA